MDNQLRNDENLHKITTICSLLIVDSNNILFVRNEENLTTK